MGDYVAEFLRALGAEVRLDEIEPGRPNVVAEFHARKKGRPAPGSPSRRISTPSASRA